MSHYESDEIGRISLDIIAPFITSRDVRMVVIALVLCRVGPPGERGVTEGPEGNIRGYTVPCQKY